MKAIAGREFPRMIERRGWQLLRVGGSHHITANPAASFACRYPFMAIARSKPACFVIWLSSPKFPMMNCVETV
jgi:hypothetical protein